MIDCHTISKKLQFLKSPLRLITAPISDFLYLFVSLVILLCLPNLLYWIIERGETTMALSIVAVEALIVYLMLLPVRYLGKFRKIYLIIIALLFFLCTVIDVVCLWGMRAPINKDFFYAIIHSNVTETNEFFANTINRSIIIVFSLTLILSIVAYFALKSKKIKSLKKSAIATFCFLCLCVVMVGRNPYAIFYSSIQKVRYAFIVRPLDDISSLTNNPDIEILHEPKVNNLVFIIGESFNKDHSSLYGYQRITNPCLQTLSDSGQLIIFNHVRSNAAYTDLAYKNIFSTYDSEYNQEDWYKNPNIFEILQKGGIKTRWFSNQSKFGYYDGIASRFSQLCDTALFTRNINQSLEGETFDELILPLLYEEQEPTVDFVALLGMHELFSSRYPQDRAFFRMSEYTEYQPHQREDIMNYDNAVVYNDSVVNEIINFYADKESLVFYFPDHAIDLYHTRDDYCNHAIYDNVNSLDYCKQVPFVVFVSDSLASKCPELKDRLRSIADNGFNTTNIIYTIMDITGVRIKDEVKTDSLSLFKDAR